MLTMCCGHWWLSLSLAVQRQSSDESFKKLVPLARLKGPASIIPKMRHPRLMDIDPTEMARQLCLLSHERFARIKPYEFLSRHPSDAASIRAMTDFHNQLTVWTKYEVLVERDTKRRAAIIRQFVQIAEVCCCMCGCPFLRTESEQQLRSV